MATLVIDCKYNEEEAKRIKERGFRFSSEAEEEIVQLYDEGVPCKKIAEKMECSPVTIREYLRHKGRNPRRDRAQRREEIIRKYLDEDADPTALAEAFKLKRVTIIRVLQEVRPAKAAGVSFDDWKAAQITLRQEWQVYDKKRTKEEAGVSCQEEEGKQPL